MKIIHIIFCFQIGGIETMLVDILNEQAKTMHKLDLVIVNDDYDPDLVKKIAPRVRVRKLHRKKGYNTLWVAAKINMIFMKERPDVVQFHDPNGINLFLNKKSFSSVLTLHSEGYDVGNWYKYTTICAVSKSVQKDIEERSSLKAELIYNGVHLKDIRKNQTKSTGYKVVQVGRLNHLVKGQDVLLKAISILQKKHPNLPISIDFIGGGRPVDYLQNLIEELGVQNTSFVGVKDRASIYQELANYDLFVQPSYIEGFGLTIVEALAAGLPVLISDLEGPKEVIDGGKYGWIFKVGDPEECAAQIEKILINKEHLVDVSELDKYISDNFDVEKTALKYIDLYERIAKR